MAAMKRIAAFSLTFALAAATYGDWRDQKWSYEPDKTADWYKLRGQPLPDVAPELTTAEANNSYVVKLECLGCPFRVRKRGLVAEEWQQPPQDNSLLLNFTIDASKPLLLLNNDPIMPLEHHPAGITAFQVPANTSVETMSKMVNQHMLDRSWLVGTKYGRFEIQYEHTLLGTKQPGEQWLQFDVTGIHIRDTYNSGSYQLQKEGQKMVQVLLGHYLSDNQHHVTIKDIQIVERKDRQQPIMMPCGKPAMIRTDYDPREWDYYGKHGTFERSWNYFTWGALQWFERNALVFIIISIILGVVGIVRWRIRRIQEQAVALANEDAETAYLIAECDDAPPEYSDVNDADQKENEQ